MNRVVDVFLPVDRQTKSNCQPERVNEGDTCKGCETSSEAYGVSFPGSVEKQVKQAAVRDI